MARVTSPGAPVVAEDRAAAVAGLPGVLELLQFMLVRDPRLRPSLADVAARCEGAQSRRADPRSPAASGDPLLLCSTATLSLSSAAYMF